MYFCIPHDKMGKPKVTILGGDPGLLLRILLAPPIVHFRYLFYVRYGVLLRRTYIHTYNIRDPDLISQFLWLKYSPPMGIPIVAHCYR